MIKQLFAKLTKKSARKDTSGLVSISRDNHTLSRKNVSPNAMKVLSRLRSSGYDAYLVGGCVRDILLGKEPKDFDIATNATPEEIRKVFNNSRIIGRRFKLIHVTFGRDIIEVATFRGSHDNADEVHQSKTSEDGMLLRDNVYGSIEQDALRRDFTINACYYTINDFSIKAMPGALSDLQNKVIRIIGDPETRYREDPVRMLRAVRFAAKLDFGIEERTASPIKGLADLLLSIPAARMFDEVLKLLQSGQGVATWALLQQYDLARCLFPNSIQLIQRIPYYRDFVIYALESTDARIGEGKSVNPAFVYAAILWPNVCEKVRIGIENGTPEATALHHAITETLNEQVKHTAIPRRISSIIREIWELQSRFARRSPKRAEALLSHPRFRAAYDFLLLREKAGEDMGGLGKWWTDFQLDNPEIRQRLTQQIRGQNDTEGKPKRRRRFNKKPRTKPAES